MKTPLRLRGSKSHKSVDLKLVEQDANKARDAREYAAAAALYESVLLDQPNNAAIHIQCGHMHKEAGRLDLAEMHYIRANELTPDDPDLNLQLGHFYKVAGKFDQALTAYRRATKLVPGWSEPTEEIAILQFRFAELVSTSPLSATPQPEIRAEKLKRRPIAYVERISPPMPRR